MNSWDQYYKKFGNEFYENHRLNIYLYDTENTVEELKHLGYRQALFTNDNKDFEDFLSCGEVALTTTFEGDDDEIEIDVIEIQHPPAKKFTKTSTTGIQFFWDSMDENVKTFTSEWFGLNIKSVHSICMFEGYNFLSDREK